MPDKYESQYTSAYGTESTGDFTASAWTAYLEATTDLAPVEGQLFPSNLAVVSYVQASTVATVYDPMGLYIYQNYETQNIEIFWDTPNMVGATHVAGFRRSGTDTIPFTPTPLDEHFRVPVETTYYVDQNVPAGNYVYQVFPLVEA
jgi:hypothetical protein